MARYLRFVVQHRNRDSRSREGFFAAASALREDCRFQSEGAERLNDLLAWFRAELPVPPCLWRGIDVRALCWYRPSATEHLRRMWELAALLREHENIELLKSSDPGRIVYRDAWQVVATPYRTRRPGGLRRGRA